MQLVVLFSVLRAFFLMKNFSPFPLDDDLLVDEVKWVEYSTLLV